MPSTRRLGAAWQVSRVGVNCCLDAWCGLHGDGEVDHVWMGKVTASWAALGYHGWGGFKAEQVFVCREAGGAGELGELGELAVCVVVWQVLLCPSSSYCVVTRGSLSL